MKLDKAIEIKQHYQYILQDASFPELIEADNLSIEALKRVELHRTDRRYPFNTLLPGETPFIDAKRGLHMIKKILESPIGREPKD